MAEKSTATHTYFQQAPPELGNQWLEDSALIEFYERVCPHSVLSKIAPDLERFGERVVGDIWELGKECERPENKPHLRAVGGWGERRDEIIVHPAWEDLQRVAAEEGLIAIGYEREYSSYSRLYQMTKQYLFAPSSAVFGCPLAMADGAARLVELYAPKELRSALLSHLLSRDPKQFWTSGQWMTERTGGSDVQASETIALDQGDGTYALYGYKFFTSATTSEMTITLARVVSDRSGNPKERDATLSAFIVATHAENNPITEHAASAGFAPRGSSGRVSSGKKRLNNIIVHKLKDKLGTRAVPTAELELIGTVGVMVGKRGRGVPTIASMFNVTRVYNAIHSVAGMRRAVAVARDFSLKRSAFGKKLVDHAMHARTLAEMDVTFRGCLYFVLDVILLQGRVECLSDPPESEVLLLRMLTPLIKLFTAKRAMVVASEALECLGGTGYMEDASDLPALLRNAQVGTIWEGTTNILSHDLLRAVQRKPTSLRIYFDAVHAKLAKAEVCSALREVDDALKQRMAEISAFFKGMAEMNRNTVESNAREVAYLLSSVYAGAVLAEHAAWKSSDKNVQVARRWISQECPPLSSRIVLARDEEVLVDATLAADIVQGKPFAGVDEGKMRARF